jgi:hypothetical protein
MERAIAYLRVSTQQEQRPGLGIEPNALDRDTSADSDRSDLHFPIENLPAFGVGVFRAAAGQCGHCAIETGARGCTISSALSGTTYMPIQFSSGRYLIR